MFGFLFVVLLLSAVCVMVKGHYPGYVVDAVFGSAPTIDGVVNVDEWSDASVIPFNNTVVYFKQDGKNLYVGFNVSDGTVSPADDGVQLQFDTDHDGSLGTKDIILVAYRNGTLAEAHGMAPLTPPTGNWTATVQDMNERWMAEFNVTYAKINVTAGEPKTLGMLIASTDSAYEEPYLWPPVGVGGALNPAVWGDLTSEANWIPEFPSAITLPLFIILSAIAIISMKKLFRKGKT